MRTTGYALREAVKRQTLRRDTAASMFSDSLHKFPDEDKLSPVEIVATFASADRAIAALQTAQMRYNLAVEIETRGERITLAEAIKRIGGAGRAEKMWRGAANPEKDRHGYGYDKFERDDTKVRSTPTITRMDAAARSNKAAAEAGDLRKAIAVANAVEIEVEGLSAELLTA